MYLGLNAPTQGATPRFHDTAAAIAAQAFVWFASEQPSDTAPYPDALHVLRLDNWHDGENPEDYVARIAPRLTAWLGVPNLIAMLGNEPDLESGHNGERFAAMAAAVRARWPTILLANPPLKAENTHLNMTKNIQSADMAACHCYWQISYPNDIDNPNLGAAYTHLTGLGKPVIVTEINAVPASGIASDTNIDWQQRNEQVTEWCLGAAVDGVHACCLFIADAAPDWAGFNVSPADAVAIRAGYDEMLAPEPPVTPEAPNGGEPMPDVYGEDLLATLAAHDGEAVSDGTLDRWNAPHLWQGWCQASVEGARDAAGLGEPTHRQSAAVQLDVVIAQGLLQYGRPEHGGICMWGRSFDPNGHTCLWDDDRGVFLTTLYGPSRIGYYESNSWYAAMAGWWRAPGVSGPRRDAEPVPPEPIPDFFFIDGNPYGEIPVPSWAWSRWDALNTMGTPLDHPGAINPAGLALPTLGYPMWPEVTLSTGRRVQQFERAVLAASDDHEPWDVVSLTLAEVLALGVELRARPGEGRGRSATIDPTTP